MLTGKSFIGNSRGAGTEVSGSGINPATGEKLSPDTIAATDQEVSRALELAEEAFYEYRLKSGAEKATFLRAIATNIEAVIEDIAARGPLETGLPEGRMRGESGRTMGQLRSFADIVEEGSWVDARIETAQPDRAPIPKVDLRSMLTGLGPVGVFCASNFPLAFSVAGGDTASALAAGCPVVVVAHSAHPGLAEIVGNAIQSAAVSTGMPEGVFSLLFSNGYAVGQTVVAASEIKAVGFTGSFAGGKALMDIAASRPEPIPVFAEMSATNPIAVLPSVLNNDTEAESFAAAASGSLTLGVGQFCTNPGIFFIPAEGAEAFTDKFIELTSQVPGATMLHPGICKAYNNATTTIGSQPNVETLLNVGTDEFGAGAPCVFRTTAVEFVSNKALSEEMFGPATLLVTYQDEEELLALAESIQGQLTTSIHAGPEDDITDLVEIFNRKSGRVIFNQFPTGVEVCSSMMHGGPFPATSDGRTTSVGGMAIFRYTRLVSYQNFPQNNLPLELQDDNPASIKRMLNGAFE
ncbi:MAG: aldehyde dehydrogenase (NADP(+)) [Akkermansiaceae bacterium]